jgi:hypothetical protein
MENIKGILTKEFFELGCSLKSTYPDIKVRLEKIDSEYSVCIAHYGVLSKIQEELLQIIRECNGTDMTVYLSQYAANARLMKELEEKKTDLYHYSEQLKRYRRDIDMYKKLENFK